MFKNLNNNNRKIYHSSEILLKILEKEYEYDFDIVNSLYTRIGIILAFIGILIGVLVSRPINLKIRLESHNLYNCIINSIPLISYFLSLFLMLISLYYLIKVILSTKIQRLDVNKGFNKETGLMDTDIVCCYMVDIYKKILLYNKPIKEKKFNEYEKAIKFLGISLIFFIFYILNYIF